MNMGGFNSLHYYLLVDEYWIVTDLVWVELKILFPILLPRAHYNLVPNNCIPFMSNIYIVF